MNAGVGSVSSIPEAIAPLLLGGSAILYGLRNSKANKLKNIYKAGGS